jgi:hypothetical protein
LEAGFVGDAARLLAGPAEVRNIAALGHTNVRQAHLTRGADFGPALLTASIDNFTIAIIGAAASGKQRTKGQRSEKTAADKSSHDAALYCTGG